MNDAGRAPLETRPTFFLSLLLWRRILCVQQGFVVSRRRPSYLVISVLHISQWLYTYGGTFRVAARMEGVAAHEKWEYVPQ